MVLVGQLSQPLNSSAQEGLCLHFTFEETEAPMTVGSLLVRDPTGTSPRLV